MALPLPFADTDRKSITEMRCTAPGTPIHGRLMQNRLCTRRLSRWLEGSLYLVHVSGLEAAYMRKKSRKPPSRKIVLRLPDLGHTKSAVLNSLSSPHSRRNYKFAMEQFIP